MDNMDALPRYEEAVIPNSKFLDYALNVEKQPDKARTFNTALGYSQDNAEKLIEQIKENLGKFPAKHKGNKGYGNIYEVIMELPGANGKSAKVLTAWIDDITNGEIRLTSVYVDK